MNLKIKIVSVALFTMFSLWAQDSVLVKEVTVSQEYNPTVNDAFKIGTAPTMDAPMSYSPTFEYGFFNAPLRTTYAIQFLGADAYTPSQRLSESQQNYIKGGGGNYSTLYGELFYNAYNSEKQNVNIFYKNRSSWGDVTLQDDRKVDAPMISNYGKVDFQRRYRHSVLNSALTFDRKGYEYYGFSTSDDVSYSYLDDATSVVSETGRQVLTNIGFDLVLTSLPRRGSDVIYNAGFAFNSASNNDKFSENQFDLKGAFDKRLDKVNLGFDAALTLGFYGDAEAGVRRAYKGDTYFEIALDPYVSFKKKNWDLKLGAIFELYQMDANQEVLAAPMIDFNFNIVPKYFTGYLTSGGGITKNTYAEVTQVNPFVANDITRTATRTLLDIDGGIVGHPTKTLSLKLGVGYKIVKDQLFYINEFVSDNHPSLVWNDAAYTNRFVAEYDDDNVLSFHGEVNYNTHKRWSASAAFDYYSHSLATLPEAWNMPLYKISAFGHYDVSEKIRVKGTFVFMPERAVKVSQSNAVDQLPASYDLSLNGEYKFKKNLSFFLELNNMLGSKYYHFNGYPAYRFNALAGATFRF